MVNVSIVGLNAQNYVNTLMLLVLPVTVVLKNTLLLLQRLFTQFPDDVSLKAAAVVEPISCVHGVDLFETHPYQKGFSIG